MRIFSSVFLLFTTFYLLFTGTAFAAELYLGVGDADVNGVRDVTLILKAVTPLNALEGAVLVPADAAIIDIIDAGSPVQFWIERPHLSDTKDKITFSGIIPGGFSGEAALFQIHTKADPAKFVVDKEATRMLLNDGAGTADIIKLGAERPLPAQFVLPESVDDKTAPHPFTPEKALLPTESGETPSLVFNAHDDESGIARYEIAYSPVPVDPSDPSLVWESTNNPAPLQPAQSNKFIYVKAIDRAGNIRIAEVPPSSRISGLLMHDIIIFFATISIACAIMLSVLFFRRRRAKHVIHNAQSFHKKK